MERQNIFSSFQDAFVPFPRTSGAKFCNVGKFLSTLLPVICCDECVFFILRSSYSHRNIASPLQLLEW